MRIRNVWVRPICLGLKITRLYKLSLSLSGPETPEIYLSGMYLIDKKNQFLHYTVILHNKYKLYDENKDDIHNRTALFLLVDTCKFVQDHGLLWAIRRYALFSASAWPFRSVWNYPWFKYSWTKCPSLFFGHAEVHLTQLFLIIQFGVERSSWQIFLTEFNPK